MDTRSKLQLYERMIIAARANLRRQVELSAALREYLSGKPTLSWPGPTHELSPVQVGCYQAMLRAIEISASALLRLSEPVDDHVRDCFPIARSIVETAVNLAYVAVMGEECAEQARLHSVRRSVQDLERRINIGGLEFHRRACALDEPDEVPGLRIELERLAGEEAEGHGGRKWTPLSVPQRIGVVLTRLDGNIGRALAHTYFYIYADASEILHGSVYGCFLSPQGTIREQEVSRHDQAFSLLLGIGMVINEAVETIGSAHELSDVVDIAKVYSGAFGDYLGPEAVPKSNEDHAR